MYLITMAKLEKCENCKNDVPTGGQCNKCGFVQGVRRLPTEAEFLHARAINNKAKYLQFNNVDMVLLEVSQKVLPKK